MLGQVFDSVDNWSWSAFAIVIVVALVRLYRLVGDCENDRCPKPLNPISETKCHLWVCCLCLEYRILGTLVSTKDYAACDGDRVCARDWTSLSPLCVRVETTIAPPAFVCEIVLNPNVRLWCSNWWWTKRSTNFD